MQLSALINRNALFVAHHSGGKDSMAELEHLLSLGIPKDQILVAHASLGRVEHQGALEKAQEHAQHHGLSFLVAKAQDLQGREFDLLDMVRRNFKNKPQVPAWPSSGCRQCTSDLKRGPLQREVGRWAKAHGFNVVVDCIGLRAEESDDRAKEPEWKANKRRHGKKVQGRRNTTWEWYTWLPIQQWTVGEVWAAIKASGVAAHKAYAEGNERLSCVLCVMASVQDLALGARAYPALAAEYIALEAETGYTMHSFERRPLAQLIAEGEAKLAKKAAA